MNRRRFVITLLALLALLLATSGATGQGPDSEGEAHPRGDVSIAGTVRSRISYQGRLLEDDAPVTGSRNMVFRLYSDGTCATQVGSNIVKNGVQVTGGLFSVELGVTHSDFNGQGLWLEVEVDGTAMGCQEILPVPYALSLRPGAKIDDTASTINFNRYQLVPFPTITTHKYGIEAEVDGSYSYAYGLWGSATATDGTAYGVFGMTGNSDPPAAGVYGEGGHYGVSGKGDAFGVNGEGLLAGVRGYNDSGHGVIGIAADTSGQHYGVWGSSSSSTEDSSGVFGKSTATSGQTYGVRGESDSTTAGSAGVSGKATAASGQTYGVSGRSDSPTGAGVYGFASSQGVLGESDSSSGIGVRGKNSSTDSDSDGIGVQGSSYYGIGVLGLGGNGVGVRGEGLDVGVYADSTSGTGVYAESDSGVGVHAISNSDTALWAQTSGGVAGVDARNTGGGHGVYAESAGPGGGGAAVYAQANGADGIALWGNSNSTDATLVVVNDGTGDLIRGFGSGWNFGFRVENDGRTTVPVLAITGGSDLSEQFDVTAAGGEVAPGLVACIDAKHPGKLLVCTNAYDRTVAGVVSGAGGIEPGMVMGQQGSPADGAYPVALTGRVYVWADASTGPIQAGDLLTTSDTAGHVMRVSDYEQAQGAIIGKAMSSLDEGQGLILVLVSLQ
jgi:hypothetical protein